jgi:hypothetical protein
MVGEMTAGGDELPKVLAAGETVTAEWDYNAVEGARVASNGEPFNRISFIDAFGREHSAPYPGVNIASIRKGLGQAVRVRFPSRCG